MRKRKFEWRKALPPSACEELEVWMAVLLGLVAGLLLYATLTAQAARAAEFPSDVGVSAYTSLVAVAKTPARSAAAALERRDVQNSMPAGAQWQAAFPKTATPGLLLRWLGAITLIVAGLLTVATHLPRRLS